MLISFYDKNMNIIPDNSSLVIDGKSYSLIKRGVDFDSLKCECEPYTADIQPTFIVVKSDIGRYIYAALAGLPEKTAENKTVINAADIKTMLNSDVLLDYSTYSTVEQIIEYILAQWNTQVNQNSFAVEIGYKNFASMAVTDFAPVPGKGIYNAWEQIQEILRFYKLYIYSELNIVDKKVVFTVGKAMTRNINIKLWELGVENFGRWIANINETQGYIKYTDKVSGTETWTPLTKWIITSANQITSNVANRDIYPIKRKLILKETDNADEITKLTNEANIEALKALTESMYQENIEINAPQFIADLDAQFSIYTRQGGTLYKTLPCGELHYDASGLKKIQIGYRFQGLEFIS